MDVWDLVINHTALAVVAFGIVIAVLTIPSAIMFAIAFGTRSRSKEE